MSFWQNELKLYYQKLGAELLLPDLIERDKRGEADEVVWDAFRGTELFHLPLTSGQLDLERLASMLNGLAHGGLDVPMVSSLAAHAVIARDLILNFGTAQQKSKYLPQIEEGVVRAAIGNSEAGAGTNLRLIKSQCVISPEGGATLEFSKPCVTNGHGSLFLISVWKRLPSGEPRLALFIVERNEASTVDIAKDLSAFRTGITGSVRGKVSDFPYREREMTGDPLEIFKHCFNLERLFIGVIVGGALQGIESEAKKNLALRMQKTGKPIHEQWLMDKLLRVTAARVKINALVEHILRGHQRTGEGRTALKQISSSRDLEKFSTELGVLKILVNEDAFEAATGLLEVIGHHGLLTHQRAQKVVRDFMALRFFGGTTELQKMSIFDDVFASAEEAVESRVELRKAN